MRVKILLPLALIFLLNACGSPPKKTAKAQYRKGDKKHAKVAPRQPRNGDLEDVLYEKLDQGRSGIHYAKYIEQNQNFDIPYTDNQYVQKWINYFTGTGRKHFARYLARAGRFVPYIQAVSSRYNVPKDLAYLSMIESGFNVRAQSWASAVGPWQFIRSTGALYGLNVDYYVDERRDVEKATNAAVRHLKDLYEEFGDWYLAFAGYNAGAGKVRNAIKRHGNNFWDMARGNYLRQETKDYVPKIIAAAMIAKNPKKYGFTDVRFQTYIPYETVKMKGATDLEVAANCAGVEPDLVRLLNPELLRDITPPQIPNYSLKIPKGTAQAFEKKYATLSPAQRGGAQEYVAERGDSPTRIAARFGVPVSELIEANVGKIDVDRSTKREKVKVAVRGRRGKVQYRWENREKSVASYDVASGTRLTIPKSRSRDNYESSRDDIAAYRAGERFGDSVMVADAGDAKRKDKKPEKLEKEKSEPLQIAEAPKVKLPESSRPKSDLDEQYLAANVDSNKGSVDSGRLEALRENRGADWEEGSEKAEIAANTPTSFPKSDFAAPSSESLQAAVRNLKPEEDAAPEKEAMPEVVPVVAKKMGVPLVATVHAEEKLSPVSKPRVEAAPPSREPVVLAKAEKVVKKSSTKPQYHLVKAGETLQEVAAKYDVSMSDLKDWNGKRVHPNLLSGLRIVVQNGPKKAVEIAEPVMAVAAAAPKKKTAEKAKDAEAKLIVAAKPVKYKVKAGDNLIKIAARHDTTPEKIQKINGLKSQVAPLGAILRIPR